MGIIFFIIFIIGAIIIFKNRETRFPNNPTLGCVVCVIGLAIGLYLLYTGICISSSNAAYNAGYRDAFK